MAGEGEEDVVERRSADAGIVQFDAGLAQFGEGGRERARPVLHRDF